MRTAGLTDSWEFELPHVPFNLEFDPFLELGAITTLPDSNRDEQIQQAIRLELAEARDGEPVDLSRAERRMDAAQPAQARRDDTAVMRPGTCDLTRVRGSGSGGIGRHAHLERTGVQAPQSA